MATIKKKKTEDQFSKIQKSYGLKSPELIKQRILWKAVAQIYHHQLGQTPEGLHWLEVSKKHWQWCEDEEELRDNS